jgi:type IV pilus assembly protein PilC
MRGTLEVADQGEAIRRIKEMGLFPTRVSEKARRIRPLMRAGVPGKSLGGPISWFGGRVKSRNLAVFTRQLATLIDAGMPLLRGLRLLAEQEESRGLKKTIGGVALSIENGSCLADAMAQYPRAFDGLYINMVKAGELSGAM